MNRKWFFVGFVAVPGLLALLCLGGWQMKRLAWKEALLENIRSNLEGERSRLPKNLEKTEHNYKMIEVEGFLESRSIFILTPVKGSGAGFRVISPLKLKDGSKILIDRGVIKEQDTDLVEKLALSANKFVPKIFPLELISDEAVIFVDDTCSI